MAAAARSAARGKEPATRPPPQAGLIPPLAQARGIRRSKWFVYQHLEAYLAELRLLEAGVRPLALFF